MQAEGIEILCECSRCVS